MIRELAITVVVSFFFIVGVILGAIIMQPNLQEEIGLIVGIVIAVGAVVLFVSFANLIIEALRS